MADALTCMGLVVGVPLVIWLGLMATDWALRGDDRADG